MTKLQEAFIRGFNKRAAELIGGSKGVNPRDVDGKELSMGTKDEKEHTPNVRLAKQIALDHLKQNPKYYSKLNKAGL